MAFVTPRLFPGPFCWKDCPEGIDPLEILDGDPIFGARFIYPFRLTLKQIMELYWINQIFDVSGNVEFLNQEGDLIYNDIAYPNSSFANPAFTNNWGLENKMSRILCPDSGLNQSTVGTYNDIANSDFAGTLVLSSRFLSPFITPGQGNVDHRILRKKIGTEEFWYPIMGVRVGRAGIGVNTFPTNGEKTPGVTFTLTFTDGSKVTDLGTNVSQIPGSRISGNVDIRLQVRRENS